MQRTSGFIDLSTSPNSAYAGSTVCRITLIDRDRNQPGRGLQETG